MALSWDTRNNIITTPAGSDIGPSLAAYDGRLYAAWKGCVGDRAMWYSSFDGQTWGPQDRILNGESDVGPSLAVFRGDLYAECKGSRGDQDLWYTSFNGTSWVEWRRSGGASSIGSSIVAFRSILFSAYKARDACEDIYYHTFNGSSWAENIKTNFQSSATPAVTVVGQGADQRLFMAWKGSGMDDKIWYSTFDGSKWVPRQAVPPPVASSSGPALTVMNNTVHMAWRGIDDRIWLSTFEGGFWTPQTPLPVGPAPGSYGPSLAVLHNELYVAWKGRDTRIWWARASHGGRRPHGKPTREGSGFPEPFGVATGVSQIGGALQGPPPYGDIPSYGGPPARDTYNSPPAPPTGNVYGGPPTGNTYGSPPGPPPGDVYGGPPTGNTYGSPPGPPPGDTYGQPTGGTYGAPPGPPPGNPYGGPPTGSSYSPPPLPPSEKPYGGPPTGSTYSPPPGPHSEKPYGGPPTGSTYSPPPGLPSERPYGGPPTGNTYGPPPENPYGGPPAGNTYGPPSGPPPENPYGGPPTGNTYSPPPLPPSGKGYGGSPYGGPQVATPPPGGYPGRTAPTPTGSDTATRPSGPPPDQSYSPYGHPQSTGGYFGGPPDSAPHGGSNVAYGSAPPTNASYAPPPGPPPSFDPRQPQYGEAVLPSTMGQQYAPGQRQMTAEAPSEPEDWDNEITWAVAKPESLVTFHEIQKTPTTDWNVLTVIVNKPNTRLAVVSYDAAQEYVNFQLCTPSARVIWQRNDVMPEALDKIVLPAFSEDGKHFVVFLEDNLHVFDARTAATVDVVNVKDNDSFKVSAFAISKNGREVAVSSPKENGSNTLERIVVPQAQGNRPINVFSHSGLYGLTLAYTSRDRRLIAVGKTWGHTVGGRWWPGSRHCTIFCWDVPSRTLLLSPEFGEEDARVDAPLHTLIWNDEPSVLVRLHHLESAHRNTMHVFAADGRGLTGFGDDWIQHTVCDDNVIILNKNRKLQLWKSGSERVEVATIDSKRLPPIQEIKGFAVSEWLVTLVLDNGRFIVLRRS